VKRVGHIKASKIKRDYRGLNAKLPNLSSSFGSDTQGNRDFPQAISGRWRYWLDLALEAALPRLGGAGDGGLGSAACRGVPESGRRRTGVAGGAGSRGGGALGLLRRREAVE
jgi:hypothetical protein